MYTSYIGKKFLKYYNEEYNKSYSAESFFDQVMFPLFFDDEKYFMRVKNSPFDQLTTAGAKKKLYKKQNERIEANNKLKVKIHTGELAVHTFVGYGEMNSASMTSGQISNLNFTHSIEDFYCSWIGQGLAFKIGKYSILCDNKEILLHIFNGWESYRELLKKTPKLVKNQVNAWNSKWLLNNFKNKNIRVIKDGDLETKKTVTTITTTSWVKLLFELSKYFPNRVLTINVYEIGDKTNVSYGFINIFLNDFNELYELRDKYFIDSKKSILSDKQIEALVPFFNFNEACKQGTLGLKSIEPKGLRKYMPKSSYKYSKGKHLQVEKEKNYYLYKLWILAMLNKKELHSLSKEIAQILVKIDKTPSRDARGKTIKKNFLTDLFDSNSTKEFIDNMTGLNLQMPDAKDTLSRVVEQVVIMPSDNFPLFITLIKFEFYNKIA